MLELTGISYRYEGQDWLFNNLNLKVSQGEIIGIYGSSGVGKSTMAKVAAGYLAPQEGQVFVHKKPLNEYKVNPVQLVWQHPEKVINPKWRLQRIIEESGGIDSNLLEEIGIRQEWLKRWPSELSGGELQRFCLARALGPNTRYLIADEMTTMLDAITQAQIWHFILKLVSKNKIGVLAISHDMDLLKQVCTKVIPFQEIKK